MIKYALSVAEKQRGAQGDFMKKADVKGLSNEPQVVRLKPDEIKKIRDAVHEYDKEAGIYIFGSRADLNKKGGDLDILVISKRIAPIQRRFIKINMYKALGEQKIDIIVTEEISSPFLKMAVQTGVRL